MPELIQLLRNSNRLIFVKKNKMDLYSGVQSKVYHISHYQQIMTMFVQAVFQTFSVKKMYVGLKSMNKSYT